MKSFYYKNKITYHHAISSDDLDQLTSLYLKQWQSIELPSVYLHDDPSKFEELFKDEIRQDLESAMMKGICIYAKYDGKIIGFTAARDVNDIEMPILEKPYEVKYEAFERVMGFFFTLMKDAHKRGQAIYLEFIATTEEFKNTGLDESLLSVIGYTILNRGFTDVYAIPINKDKNYHMNYDHEIVSEVDLDNLIFGDVAPFKGINFKIPLIRLSVSGNFSSLFSKVNMIENRAKL